MERTKQKLQERKWTWKKRKMKRENGHEKNMQTWKETMEMKKNDKQMKRENGHEKKWLNHEKGKWKWKKNDS